VGYDAGKQVKGRKTHALVDSEALPMPVMVHSAAIQDRDGTRLVLDKRHRRFPCRLSGENSCTIVKVIFDFQYNLRSSWPDLIRPSTEASPRSEGVDGRVEHGHDETWLGL